MSDMEHEVFALYPYGKAALKKLGEVPENFRLFYAGWLGPDPTIAGTMKLRGAVFRRAKTGINKGKMTIMVPGTQRTVYINKVDIDEYHNIQ